MSLSERVRPGVEAAPWVVQEIAALEARVKELEAVDAARTNAVQDAIDNAAIYQDQLTELKAKVRELEAERDAYKLVAEGEKLDAYQAMQEEFAASRQQVERLVEALVTIDQKLEAAVLCEAKTGQLMQASPLRLDVYKALAAVEKEPKP